MQKKVCLLGAYGVGKTSLVARFVHRVFSEKYLSTLGVRVDRKVVSVEGQELNLLLWDLSGEDQFQPIQPSYMRGSAGYLLVADCTRPETLDTALSIHTRAQSVVGQVPFVLLLNKSDLPSSIEASKVEALKAQGWPLFQTSAKSGEGVEEAFSDLAGRMYLGKADG
jgi:hypothetical protein